MNVNVVITGATGMVGEGVLNECLKSSDVKSILVIGRKSCSVSHFKLKELILSDISRLPDSGVDFKNYNACFFCAGVSSVGMNEKDYTEIIYNLTINFAEVLCGMNPDMTFCFVSGTGTDSSEKGRIMWARIKGKTENALMKLPFRQVFNFRPAFLKPSEGMKNTLSYYKYIGWMYPFLRIVFPGFVMELRELGIAMINSVSKGYNKKILEVKDIVALAEINT